MSFRVKLTHKFLKPPVQEPVQNAVENKDDNEDSPFYLFDEKDNSKQTSSSVSKPTGSNQQGMAIRNIPSAQADYM